MEKYTEIKGLLLKHLQSELTEEESAALGAWVAQSEQNRQFFERYINNTQALLADVRAVEAAKNIDVEKALNRLKEQTREKPAISPQRPVIQMRRWATSAAVVIGLAILIPLLLLWFVHPGKPANLPGRSPNLVSDVMPGMNKAYLTLDDGKKIMLDSTKNGEIALQGSMQIEKKDGQVSYAVYNAASTDEILYNKVTVPNGGDVVPLELGDGSKVWLNAGSTISYPVIFEKAERKVEVSGEAYFEVAGADDGKVTPFIVSKGDLTVEVLGTKFNVNTYTNEDDIKVTLLDGSAKVQYGQSARIIKAGEQAIISHARISVTDSADLEQAVAWKHGIFQFNNADIKQIMRQLERWYDLAPTRYENQASTNLNLSGAISRYNNASDVLKLLEKTGIVHFKIEGKKIIVKQ